MKKKSAPGSEGRAADPLHRHFNLRETRSALEAVITVNCWFDFGVFART